ncbi:MAG: hypothetical protein WBO46_00030 [Caldilineaceae bacterium]
MSQLNQAAIASTGDSQQFSPITWEDFVQIVIDLTIQAYQQMRRECPVEKNWEENTFTIRLAKEYLLPLSFDNLPSLRVTIRSKTHTREMEEGRQATIEAKEMDLCLYDVWERDYLSKHFVWEAKRVGSRNFYGSLISEYVNEAVYRFIALEYAAGLSDAGVLGYVLAGNVPDVVNDINQTMGRIRKNTPLLPSNHLNVAPAIHQFNDLYRSNHTRTDNSLIQLHHLFLTFDFADG